MGEKDEEDKSVPKVSSNKEVIKTYGPPLAPPVK